MHIVLPIIWILILSFFGLFFRSYHSSTGNENECPFDYTILWSSTYSHAPFLTPPLICDLDGDNFPDIVGALPSGEVFGIHGESGFIMDNWPVVFDDFQFHSSPLLFDFNKDGLDDIVLFTECAKVMYVSSSGKLFSSETIQIPPLVFHRYWYLEDVKVIDVMLDEFSSYYLTNYKYPVEDVHFFHLGIDPDNSSRVIIPPHINVTPIVGSTHLGSDSNEFIIPLSFYFIPSELVSQQKMNLLGGFTEEDLVNYLVSAILVLDPFLRMISQFTILSVDRLDRFKPALLMSIPAIYNFKKNSDRSLTVASVSGFLYRLTLPKLQFAPGFPVDMGGSISSTPVVYDINGDGILETISITDQNVVVCTDILGNVLWNITLEGKLSIGGGLRIMRLFSESPATLVTATHTGLLYAINPTTGSILPNYPIDLGMSVSSAPLLLSFSSEFDPFWVIFSDNGDMILHSHSAHCTKLIHGDFSLISYVPVLYNDFINSHPGMEFLVSSNLGTISVLSIFPLTEPIVNSNAVFQNDKHESIVLLDRWDTSLICQCQNLHRNISLSVVVANIHDQISGIDTMVVFNYMTISYVISDRLFPKGIDPRYFVTGSLGQIQVFSSIHLAQGSYSVTFDIPPISITGMLSISLNNEHGIYDCVQIPVTFNENFKIFLKWSLFAPFLCSFVVILVLNLDPAVLLPK